MIAEKLKMMDTKKIIIYFLTIILISVVCFCIFVYLQKKSLKDINLSDYTECDNSVSYVPGSINNENGDINIKCSIIKDKNSKDNSNIYIALSDIDDGNTFVINTYYDRTFRVSSDERININNISVNARCLKDSLNSGHKYNVYVVLENGTSKRYIKTSEVVKC